MNLRYNNTIIVFLISLILSLLSGLNAFSQDVPVACAGSIVRYGVYGDNGNSIFQWDVTGGQIINNYNDSVDVLWPVTTASGAQTITVTETNNYGCLGNPYSTIVILSNPEVEIADDPHICFGATFEFTATSTEAINYLWSDNSTASTFIASSTGEYWVRIQDADGCRAFDTTYLTVHDNPIIDLGNDTALCEPGQTLTLELDVAYSSYLWTLGELFWSSPTLTVEPSTEKRTYYLEVTDEWGCIGYDTITVSFCGTFLIPNAFTPNGDGVNDEWRIDNLAYFEDCKVDIYDRRGERVFSSKGYEKAWDGTDSKGRKMPMDSYYYVIDLKNGEKPFVGTVTLLR